jgi:hypothetical protein
MLFHRGEIGERADDEWQAALIGGEDRAAGATLSVGGRAERHAKCGGGCEYCGAFHTVRLFYCFASPPRQHTLPGQVEERLADAGQAAARTR